MGIRVESYIHGFMSAIKPHMTTQDYDFLAFIFKEHKAYPQASRDEGNPAKPAHFFRLRSPHLNVLLPIWIMNDRQTAKTDRFRIASTPDHSFIIDTRESVIYDPTTETLHAMEEYRPLAIGDDWKEETLFRLRDDLNSKRLIIQSLGQRIENLPTVYGAFIAFLARHRLRPRVKDLRFDLDLKAQAEAAHQESESQRAIIELAMNELWSRKHVK